MGTHPIFESDFDCLTEIELERIKLGRAEETHKTLMNIVPEQAHEESVEALLAFTVDKRQRNAEAASPELRKEALLSNTVRQAHQRRRSSAPCKSFFTNQNSDELVDVDDVPTTIESIESSDAFFASDNSTSEHCQTEENDNLQKMSELLHEINVISSPGKRKRLYDEEASDSIFSESTHSDSSSLLASPCKRGKPTRDFVPESNNSLMET